MRVAPFLHSVGLSFYFYLMLMGTTVIDNDWRSMFLNQMSDAEAGRLFKAIMDIRC